MITWYKNFYHHISLRYSFLTKIITIDIFHLLLKPLLRIFVLKCDCPARLCGNTCGHPDLDCHHGSGKVATMILVILMIVITTSTLQRNKDLVAEPLSRRLAESREAETSRWFQVVAWWRVRCLRFVFIFVIVLAICTVICS